MSNIKKYEYTTGGLFTLTGSPYIGYFNIFNNAAYVGKYTQNILLTNVDSIKNAVTISDDFFDRLITQQITLTYSLSDFLFQSNEIINKNSINLKLEKAYTNFIDIYRAGFIASSNLPNNFTGLATISANYTGTSFVWASGNAGTNIIDLTAYNTQINTGDIISYFPNTYNTNCTLIVASSSTLTVFKVNDMTSTFTVVFSSNLVETNNVPGYGSLPFGNIVSMAKSGNNLYICDEGNNSIYSYDITSIVDEDRALGYKFNLTNSVNNNQGNFLSPGLIEATDSMIYLYDTGAEVVYFYDTNFNLKSVYKNSRFFTQSTPVDLTYYKIYDQLFILTSDFKLVILDSSTNATFYDLYTTGMLQDEIAVKLVFSNTNSNIFYVMSNKTIYKKFVTNPVQNIGSFSFTQGITGNNSQLAGNLLYDMDTYDSQNNYDDLMVFGYGQFLNYNEQTIFNSTIK